MDAGPPVTAEGVAGTTACGTNVGCRADDCGLTQPAARPLPAASLRHSASVGLSWLALEHAYDSCGTHVHHADRRNCCGLILHAEGRLRSIVDGRETSHQLLPGMVGFVPADDARHTVIVSNDRPTDAFLVLVPRDALANLVNADDIAVDVPEAIAFFDPVIHRLLTDIRHAQQCPVDSCHTAAELVRRVLLRATERLAGRRPVWRDDCQPFDARTLADIVANIDAHLAAPPRLEDVAARVGLSPSHCARKFRVSTGMSLGRFLGLRRVQAALDRLHGPDVALARMSCDLGFSSQSHFTRTMSGWTGMTPARYRRAFTARRGSA